MFKNVGHMVRCCAVCCSFEKMIGGMYLGECAVVAGEADAGKAAVWREAAEDTDGT